MALSLETVDTVTAGVRRRDILRGCRKPTVTAEEAPCAGALMARTKAAVIELAVVRHTSPHNHTPHSDR